MGNNLHRNLFSKMTYMALFIDSCPLYCFTLKLNTIMQDESIRSTKLIIRDMPSGGSGSIKLTVKDKSVRASSQWHLFMLIRLVKGGRFSTYWISKQKDLAS